MAIVEADIKYYISGGAANADPNASLGGAISSTEMVDNTLHNLFDKVLGAESADGDVEYRCVYIKNTHATLTAELTGVYINTNTTSPDTSAKIGLGTSAISATEQTIADEDTAPAGVSFSTAAGAVNALSIGSLAPGETKAIWIEWTVNASASAYNSDTLALATAFDTAA